MATKEHKHHCCVCGKVCLEQDMQRKSYHPRGMKSWWLNYHYYCASCAKFDDECSDINAEISQKEREIKQLKKKLFKLYSKQFADTIKQAMSYVGSWLDISNFEDKFDTFFKVNRVEVQEDYVVFYGTRMTGAAAKRDETYTVSLFNINDIKFASNEEVESMKNFLGI